VRAREADSADSAVVASVSASTASAWARRITVDIISRDQGWSDNEKCYGGSILLCCPVYFPRHLPSPGSRSGSHSRLR
jgi:hypothetical protein